MKPFTLKIGVLILAVAMATPSSEAAKTKQQQQNLNVEQKKIQESSLLINERQMLTMQQAPENVQSESSSNTGSATTLVQKTLPLNVVSGISGQSFNTDQQFQQQRMNFLLPFQSGQLIQQQPHSLYGFPVQSISQAIPLSPGQNLQFSHAVPVSQTAPTSSQTFFLAQPGQPQQQQQATIQQKPIPVLIPVNQMSRTIEYRTVPNQMIEAKPQMIEIPHTPNSVQLHFTTRSSPIFISQSYEISPPQEMQFVQTQEPATRIVQEINKPVLQEYREFVQPTRFREQYLHPVQDRFRSVVHKFEGKPEINPQLIQVQHTKEEPLVLYQSTAQTVPVEKNVFMQTMEPSNVENVQPAPVEKKFVVQTAQQLAPVESQKVQISNVQSVQQAPVEQQTLIQNVQPAGVEKQFQFQQAQPQQIQFQPMQQQPLSYLQLINQRRQQPFSVMMQQPSQYSMINLQQPSSGQMLFQSAQPQGAIQFIQPQHSQEAYQQAGQPLFLELVNANEGQMQFVDQANQFSGQQQFEMNPSQFQMIPAQFDNMENKRAVSFSGSGSLDQDQGSGLVGYQSVTRGQPMSLVPGSALHARPATTVTIESTPETMARLDAANAMQSGTFKSKFYSDQINIDSGRRLINPNKINQS